MLDRHLIRTQSDWVKAQIARKGLTAPIDEIVSFDSEYRGLRTEMDEKRAEQNRFSKDIGALMTQTNPTEKCLKTG